ncbi:MAG: LamG-like jellyroll fold domain-containing protein, partial [Verrucomicrobiales bacterium]
TAEGKPLGLLANFSMHYFGDQDISADYFGLFSDGLQEKLDPGKTGFVAMMSHGCSGDIWRHDYEKSAARSKDGPTLEQYSADMIGLALKAIDGITYESPETIAMAETRMTLAYRVPDKQRLEWSQKIVKEMGDRLPKTQPEVYAKEQIILHERQKTEIVVQGLRLGDKIAIATTPNETYALTGLKIKAASPLPHTMVIELANGGDGYIPPPEQHLLGGYNTWPARSAGLEVNAEPKITEAAIQMLEKVSQKVRVDRRAEAGPAVVKTLELKPKAYWRLDEFAGPRAIDSSPNGIDAIYEPRVLFYLPGPYDATFAKDGINRSVHLAGDRISARILGMTGTDYTVSVWFWSGSSDDAMQGTEWILSRGTPYGPTRIGDHVGIHRDAKRGRILVTESPGGHWSPLEFDAAQVNRWRWHHLVLAREGIARHIFLDGVHISVRQSGDTHREHPDTFFFGGSCTGDGNFEGRLDEIVVFDRDLSEQEIVTLYQAGRSAP